MTAIAAASLIATCLPGSAGASPPISPAGTWWPWTNSGTYGPVKLTGSGRAVSERAQSGLASGHEPSYQRGRFAAARSEIACSHLAVRRDPTWRLDPKHSHLPLEGHGRI